MKPRDYKKEYAKYQSSPEQIANRAQRNAARAAMKKKLGSAAIEGKDIDHKRRIKSGGTNSLGNLRVMSVHKNRGRNN